MRRIKIKFNSLEPFMDKAGKALSKGAHSAVKLVKSRDFRKGAALLIPAGLSSYLLIRKYQKEAEEKEKLYKEKLQKHETIVSDDIQVLKKKVEGKRESLFETELVYDQEDDTAGLQEQLQLRKIRKLDRKIGENLKLLYGYHCQICGRLIGEEFGSHVAEAHHIDYFVISLNNDANNQMILCPNHHSIIHETNPVFDRKRMLYV